MLLFLVLQAGYQNYEVGIYDNHECISYTKHDKQQASKDLIPTISILLQKNSLTLQNITFIGINYGPGPFTSLRIAIAVINGLAFAQYIPLIGCNSLEALLAEYCDHAWPYTVALLNAFNNDMYYAIQQPNKEINIGCLPGITLLQQLKQEFPDQKIRFIGNGVLLMQQHIHEFFDSQAHIPHPFPEEASLGQIARMANYEFETNKKACKKQILPLYLKNMQYKISTVDS